MLRRSLCTFNSLKIIECPRDAIQGLDFIPTASKVSYLKKLLRCNFAALDCVSFVHAKVMPQMRDSEEVLKEIGPLARETNNELLAVVANMRGAHTAIDNEHVTFVGYPLSASETFQQKNTRRSIAEALSDIQRIAGAVNKSQQTSERSATKKKQLGVCISMAFGNPYNETISAEDVCALCEKLYGMGIPLIYFADTVGRGSAEYIAETFDKATSPIVKRAAAAGNDVEFGIHLHSHPAVAEEKVKACIDAGCRRFDGAICGLGGCPFAQDDLVGNIPSETIIKVAEQMGFEHGVDKAMHAESKAALFEILPNNAAEKLRQRVSKM